MRLIEGGIICGFAGIGKSTLAKTRANVVDLESTPFKRNWQTYAAVANHMKNSGYTVLVSCHNELRTQLHNDGIEYDVVLPNPKCKEVFIRRYINRGNTEDFVALLSENWDEFCKELPWEKAVRIGAEFLADILPTIEAEPVKHGRWMPQKVLGQELWCCSECKTLGSLQWKRCPICEAKMDKEDNK